MPLKKICIIVLLLFIGVSSYAQNSLSKRNNIAFGNMNRDRFASWNIGFAGDIDSLKGTQTNFLRSIIRGNGIGYNGSIFSSITAKNLSGLQTAFFVNVVGENLKGVQISTIGNWANHVTGLQLATFSNVSGNELKGVQFSGISNISLGINKGLQFSLVMNICVKDTMNGVQISPFNYSDTLNGTQIGVINTCVSLSNGYQIGLVNYSRENAKRKIGLVNISPNTNIQMVTFLGNFSKVNIGVRFRNKNLYYALGMGMFYFGLDETFSGSLFYRLGYWKNIHKSWDISTCLELSHIESFQEDNLDIPERLYGVSAMLNIEKRISKSFGVFVGVGYGISRYYKENLMHKNSITLNGGISLF
ncbi:MAG: hypothetical protein IJ180_11190 [Bacteroidales bacterium]|nr:hypothetical protein [Bacteroidales bacterium]